ncbi:MAG: hypothetical protein IJS73_06445 [Paludibacteraceae bacterium]|nr:hypothetical protein [Paludibacteraceae bacterium]
MRTFIKPLLFCTVIALCATCKKNNVSLAEEPSDEILSPELAIIKVSPDMLKYVLVTPIVDSVKMDNGRGVSTLYYGKSLSLYNPTESENNIADFANSVLKIVGTTPYILLKNGYAIFDWKWTHYQALSGEFREALYRTPSESQYYSTRHPNISNEEYYLLNVEWNDLKDISAVWSLDEGIKIENPEIRITNLKKLSEYSHNMLDAEKYKREFDLTDVYDKYKKEPANIDKYVKERDTYQQLCVDVLNQMIDNNDFEIWAVRWK